MSLQNRSTFPCNWTTWGPGSLGGEGRGGGARPALPSLPVARFPRGGNGSEPQSHSREDEDGQTQVQVPEGSACTGVAGQLELARTPDSPHDSHLRSMGQGSKGSSSVCTQA